MTYTIFGESHGPAIGVVLEGVPSGVEMDLDFIRAELQRRAPGKSALTTARKEADEPEILSGVFDGKTTGTPLCAIIRNTDTRSKDYAKLKHLPRPSHADYAGAVRYGGFNDYRGGGHFSGRLTAPLVFAGALAKLILQEKGVIITSAISIAKFACSLICDNIISSDSGSIPPVSINVKFLPLQFVSAYTLSLVTPGVSSTMEIRLPAK